MKESQYRGPLAEMLREMLVEIYVERKVPLKEWAPEHKNMAQKINFFEWAEGRGIAVDKA